MSNIKFGFNDPALEERESIPIPMGQPSDEGVGVKGWFITGWEKKAPANKNGIQTSGISLAIHFEYRGNATNAQGVPYKGAKFTHREFDPTFVGSNISITDEQRLKNAQGVQRRIKHIIGRFVPEEKIATLPTFNTFEEYVNLLVNNMGKYTDNKECVLKLVYVKGYSAFPLYPSFISTDFSPRAFRYDPQYDKLTKEAPVASPSPAPSANQGFDSDFGGAPSEDTFAPQAAVPSPEPAPQQAATPAPVTEMPKDANGADIF